MLQYLKEQDQSPHTHLYATLEHPYFYDHSIFELAKEFVQYGYFPFRAENHQMFLMLVNQIIDTVISVDIGQTYGYNVESTAQLKRLLAIISSSVPFSINISSVASKMGIGRNTLKSFLHELEKARIINFLNRQG